MYHFLSLKQRAHVSLSFSETKGRAHAQNPNEVAFS
jgi:hypothetical protein